MPALNFMQASSPRACDQFASGAPPSGLVAVDISALKAAMEVACAPSS